MLMTPLIVPSVVVAIAVYSVYVSFHLIGSFLGIVLAHTIRALPFTVVLLVAGFQRIATSRKLLIRWAQGSPGLWRVTLPILRPSIFAAAIFAFIASWDEVIMVIFIGGGAGTTCRCGCSIICEPRSIRRLPPSRPCFWSSPSCLRDGEVFRLRGDARRGSEGGTA